MSRKRTGKSKDVAKRAQQRNHSPNTPAVSGKATVHDAVERAKGFHKAGTEAYSDSSLRSAHQRGTQFTKWLNGYDLDLETLALNADRLNNQPLMQPDIVLWFLAQTSQNRKLESTLSAIHELALWLRIQGWETSKLRKETKAGKSLRQAVKHLYRNAPKTIRIKAKPLSPADLKLILHTIDTNPMGWNELTQAAMRAYLILGWDGMLRGGEECHTLRWSMVNADTGVFHLPGGRVFKHQDEPVTIPLRHLHPKGRKSCGPRCPVQVLKDWKATCEKHGVPTSGDTLLFPAIRSDLRWNHPRVVAIFGDRAVIPDPIAEKVAQHGDTFKVRDTARHAHYIRYANLFEAVCRHAGINAGHMWQRVTTHGNRRGAIPDAIREQGVHPEIAAKKARHKSVVSTSEYVDLSPADTTELDMITEEQNAEIAGTEAVTATELRRTCQIEHHGTPCGDPKYKGLFELDGKVLFICDAHYKRAWEGKTGEEFTKPLQKDRRSSTMGADDAQ